MGSLFSLYKSELEMHRSRQTCSVSSAGRSRKGESPEAALIREVYEELVYKPRDVRFFRRYEHRNVEQYVFICEVDENFESEITVLEGEYGKFLNESELKAEKLIDVDRIVFDDVFRWLHGTYGFR